MPTPKLKIGCGVHRARRNRGRPRKITLNPSSSTAAPRRLRA
jgi:hypothetical protein